LLLMIDNYDSFTYNLVQYFGQLQVEVKVFRNDCLTIEEIKQLAPTHIVISPGPGTPDQAGISLAVIQHLAGHIPILGVCLGHQAIGQFFGGRVVQADRLMHGKTSCIYHDQKTIFHHLPSPFTATRYHSLIVEKKSLPNSLIISARTEEGEIMALRHRELPVEGVQFHPESILTEHGLEILKNFLNLSTFHSQRSNEL